MQLLRTEHGWGASAEGLDSQEQQPMALSVAQGILHIATADVKPSLAAACSDTATAGPPHRWPLLLQGFFPTLVSFIEVLTAPCAATDSVS